MKTKTHKPAVTVLTADIGKGKELTISRDDNDGITLYWLDSGYDSMSQKLFLELPKLSRSIRGCKQMAASLVGEKIKWKEVEA